MLLVISVLSAYELPHHGADTGLSEAHARYCGNDTIIDRGQDLLFLIKTWIKQSHGDYGMYGYAFINKFRKTKFGGGMYLQQEIKNVFPYQFQLIPLLLSGFYFAVMSV